MSTFTAKAILKKLQAKKKINGFTLIELMVVVAILGVLSAVALPQLTAAQNKAKISAATQTLVNAAKQCSTELITGGTVPTFANDTTNAGVVAGTCDVSETLSIKAEDGASTVVTLDIDAAGIPGVAS